MQSFCDQFWLCGTAFSAWWPFGLIVPIVAITLVAVPIANILYRAGHSRWWTILAFIPLVNLICLWIFPFGRWPALDSR